MAATLNEPLASHFLPPSLSHLYLGNIFSHPIPSFLTSLTYLEAGNAFTAFNSIPCSVTHLVITCPIMSDTPPASLPTALHTLILHNYLFNAFTIPNTLHTLRLGPSCILPNPLPSSLRRLLMDVDLPIFRPTGYFNAPLPPLPGTLTHLLLNHQWNQPPSNLPDSLTHLQFGWAFNQPIDSVLPPKLVCELSIIFLIIFIHFEFADSSGP